MSELLLLQQFHLLEVPNVVLAVQFNLLFEVRQLSAHLQKRMRWEVSPELDAEPSQERVHAAIACVLVVPEYNVK